MWIGAHDHDGGAHDHDGGAHDYDGAAHDYDGAAYDYYSCTGSGLCVFRGWNRRM